jgi:hypothetical protein
MGIRTVTFKAVELALEAGHVLAPDGFQVAQLLVGGLAAPSIG